MNLMASISLYSYGTSEGVTKGWDTRGRGQADYVYHGTFSKHLASIRKAGLRPARGQYGKAVYFAPSEEQTEGYGDKPDVMLRVHRSNLPEDYDEFPEQGWTEKKVQPEVIEMKQKDGSWKPIR